MAVFSSKTRTRGRQHYQLISSVRPVLRFKQFVKLFEGFDCRDGWPFRRMSLRIRFLLWGYTLILFLSQRGRSDSDSSFFGFLDRCFSPLSLIRTCVFGVLHFCLWLSFS